MDDLHAFLCVNLKSDSFSELLLTNFYFHSDCPQAMSPSARSSRISALENMLSSSSSAMVSMASQLSEAEERERLFSGKGRWHHVRSLPEAKNIMNYLFQLVSSARYAVHCFPSMQFSVCGGSYGCA